MKLSRSSLYRIVTGLVGMVFAPLALHAQQTIIAPSGQVGVAYSYQVSSDATAPFQYDAIGLPDGLAINQATGFITGVPTTAGTVVGEVSVTSGGQTNSAAISITIAAATSTSVITSPLTASGTVGVPFTYDTVANNNPTSYNVAGLPSGLIADPASGDISGTPTVAGVSSISLSANNAGGTGFTVMLTLTVAAPASAPVITSAASAGRDRRCVQLPHHRNQHADIICRFRPAGWLQHRHGHRCDHGLVQRDRGLCRRNLRRQRRWHQRDGQSYGHRWSPVRHHQREHLNWRGRSALHLHRDGQPGGHEL
jgi:Putative Ig domain